MLREEGVGRNRVAIGIALCAVVGALCAWLVSQGNPGNMGVCGACFARDAAGSLGLVGSPTAKVDPRFSYLRPEFVGVVLGAMLLSLLRRRFTGRSGSHAVSRLVLGAWMGIGALVFLGCPFRMLQRLGGGDLSALWGLAGFVPGVLVGVLLERRGYSVGKTSQVPLGVGLVGPAVMALLFGTWLAGGVLAGAGPGGAPPPAHAAWGIALGVGLLAGALLSFTGFCAVSAVRMTVHRKPAMGLAALALIGGYAAVAAVTGKFHLSATDQPIAHQDALWSALSMGLVGLAGALAGGCPVRQMVMAGEGNGDAFVTVLGIVLGGAVAHGLGLASSPAGTTALGHEAVLAGLAFALAYGLLLSPRWRGPSPE